MPTDSASQPRHGPDKLPHSGAKVKALFTITAAKGYAMAMITFALAALVAATAPSGSERHSVEPLVQARATVTIRRGATLHLGHRNRIEGQQLRSTTVQTADGIQRASLVEFE